MLSLPSIPAPALRKLAVTVLSYGGLKPLRMLLPAVVSTPSVANKSLMPSGIPASEPVALPESAASAAASASSGVSTVYAFSAFAPATAALKLSATSRAVNSLARSPSRSSVIVLVVSPDTIRSLGHREEAMLGLGRVGLNRLADAAVIHDIVAQP